MHPREAFYHQQQATLRNNTSDISTLWQLTKIGWAWRSRSVKSVRKSLWLLLIVILHILAFGAASILSSHITTVGNQVLIAKSPYCGPWVNSNAYTLTDAEFSETVAQASHVKMAVATSNEYVQNCLGGSNSLPECNQFKRSQLNWTSTNVPCPFYDLCLGPTNTSLYMDTGLLDSRDDLGVNSIADNKIQWRRHTTCSPIKTDGYSFSGTSSIDNTTFDYTAVLYGRSEFNVSGSSGVNGSALENATYVYTNYRKVALPFYDLDNSPYDIKSVSLATLYQLHRTHFILQCPASRYGRLHTNLSPCNPR